MPSLTYGHRAIGTDSDLLAVLHLVQEHRPQLVNLHLQWGFRTLCHIGYFYRARQRTPLKSEPARRSGDAGCFPIPPALARKHQTVAATGERLRRAKAQLLPHPLRPPVQFGNRYSPQDAACVNGCPATQIRARAQALNHALTSPQGERGLGVEAGGVGPYGYTGRFRRLARVALSQEPAQGLRRGRHLRGVLVPPH